MPVRRTCRAVGPAAPRAETRGPPRDRQGGAPARARGQRPLPRLRLPRVRSKLIRRDRFGK